MGKNITRFAIDNLTTEMPKYMERFCIELKVGGPFGAVIFKEDKIVGIGVNKVLAKHDPTAHAEIEAIRDACTNLQTHDLTGCEIYATGYPCPMCMSAIIWANIKKVYYSADYKDASKLGFRDDYIFNFIKDGQKDKNIVELIPVNKESIIKLYQLYQENNGEQY